MFCALVFYSALMLPLNCWNWFCYLFSVCSKTQSDIRIPAGALDGLRQGEVRQWSGRRCQVFAEGTLDVPAFANVLGPVWPTGKYVCIEIIVVLLRTRTKTWSICRDLDGPSKPHGWTVHWAYSRSSLTRCSYSTQPWYSCSSPSLTWSSTPHLLSMPIIGW